MTSNFNSDLQAELDCLVSSVECCDVKRREIDVMLHSYAMFNQFLPTCQLQVSSIRSNSVDVKPTGTPSETVACPFKIIPNSDLLPVCVMV